MRWLALHDEPAETRPATGSRRDAPTSPHPGGRLQPGAAAAPPDRRRHAPEPAGAGSFGALRTDRASDRPLGPSDRASGDPNGHRRRSSAQSLIANLPEQAGSANGLLPRAAKGLVDATGGRAAPTPANNAGVRRPGARHRDGDGAPPRLRTDRPRVREARLRHREPGSHERSAPLPRGQGGAGATPRPSPSRATRSSTR